MALAAEVTTLKVNLKLSEKIAKKHKPNGRGGGAASKAGTGEKCQSKKEKVARLALWQSECIALKKVPPMPGGPSTRTFTKKEHPRFGTKSNPYIGASTISCGPCTPPISAKSGIKRLLTGRITRNLPVAASRGNRPCL